MASRPTDPIDRGPDAPPHPEDRPPHPRLLGLGDNIVDTYVDEGLQFPGGNAVNVAALTARLGVATGYLGCLGTDRGGDLLASALADEGVDAGRVRRVEGANARAFIRHDRGERQFLDAWAGVRNQYRLEPEDFAYIAGFDAVHTSIFSELDAELPRLRSAVRLLSYDFSDFWTDAAFDRVLRHVDVAFVSAPDLDDQAVRDLLDRCVAGGARLVVATRGPAGSMALADGELLRQGTVAATVVDTLGAGDGFIAGFLASRLRGADPADALRSGAGFAAEVCGWKGAFGHGAPWTGDASRTPPDQG